MKNPEKNESKVAGGRARAIALTPEKRKEIAERAAIARWGEKPLQATHKGNFKEQLGIDVECYVLNDAGKTPVISQSGMARVLGMSARANTFAKFISSQSMSASVSAELTEKLQKPFIFQWGIGGAEQPPSTVHGADAGLLIDVCNAISSASAAGHLGKRYEKIVTQAAIILGASAKAGIRGLVYALAGYNPATEEVIAAFKAYVREEAKKYEKEFPSELYAEWQRLYKITPPQRGKNWKEMHLTVDHIYYPLAKSNGKLLEMLRSAKTAAKDRNNKLFSFLNEIGARALRMQIGRVLEMAESSPNKAIYEAKIIERFGGQLSLNLPPAYPVY